MTKVQDKKRVQVQVDRQLAEQAEHIFEAVGLNATTAITAFYKQVINKGGIPFALKVSERERAQVQLSTAISTLPIQKMSKKDIEDWLEDDDY